MEKHEGDITVTHFINPQLFWYQRLDALNQSYRQILQLEQKISEQMVSRKFGPRYVPVVGDKIAVNFLAWKKFIRAQVLHVNRDDEYVVWAIDYGFPFTTKITHVRRLDAALAQHIDHVRRGALAGVLAAELEFDFMENRPAMMGTDQWNQRACDSLEKLLSDAASVTFVERFQQTPRIGTGDELQFWGDLEITNHKGKKFQAADYLVAINCAQVIGPKLRDICGTLKATQIPAWLSNSGNTKVKDNAFKITSAEREGVNVERSVLCDEFAKRKVEDWCARNVRPEGIGRPEMYDVGAADLIDDITFDDSVSIKYKRLYASGTTNTNSDKIKRDNQSHNSRLLLKSSAASSGIKSPGDDKKSHNNSVEDNIYFKYLSEEAVYALDREGDFTKQKSQENTPEAKPPMVAATSSTCSGISTRKQKLLDIRRKIAASQAPQTPPSTVGSDSQSGVNYKLLQESTLDSSVTQELQEAKQMREISLTDETASVTSGMSSRARRLREICQKYAATGVSAANDKKSAEENFKEPVKPIVHETVKEKTPPTESAPPASSKHREHLRKLREQHNKPNDSEETVSVVSAASARAARLLNIRNKLKEKMEPNTMEAKREVSFFEQHPIEPVASTSQREKPFEFTATGHKNAFKESVEKELDGCKMLPAGFDLGNLNHYNDENHWHRKKTTLYDRIPHDDVSLSEECLLSTSKNTSTSSSEKCSSVGKRSTPERNDIPTSRPSSSSNDNDNANAALHNQNFRLTRDHTDKYKNNEDDVVNNKNILDATVPELDCSILEPNSNNSADDYTCLEQPEKEIIAPQYQDLPNADNSNLVVVTPKSIMPYKSNKRRELKSPALQKNKIDAILKRAKFEKQLGNSNILDLSNVNLSGSSSRTDTDDINSTDDGVTGTSTSASASGSENEAKSSNKRALIINRLQMKEKAAMQQVSANVLTLNGRTLSPKAATLVYASPPPQWTEVEGEHTLQAKFMDNLVLAHSKVPVYAAEKLSEVYFPQQIHDEMINMRLTKVFRIQAYGWPHVLRGNSLFIVNPSRSGKTLCYLVSICSLVYYRMQNNMLPDTYGPVAVILAPSSTHVEHVYKYCRRLVASCKDKVTVVASFGVRDMMETKIKLLNGCGILIVTPANLLRLLRENSDECLIDPARLLHLVVDDMDLMLSRSQEDFETSYSTLVKLRKKSGGNKEVLHLVVTSRNWDLRMVPMICGSSQPLLLMGDFLEAAVYGKAGLSSELRSSEQKIATVLRFIEKHPLHQSRLIIFCNNGDDVELVVTALTTSGHVCIGYSDRACANMRIIVDEWKRIYSSQVLVCSDDAFPELQIQNVKNLIHYSMPTSWTKFTTRFSAMAQTYENFVRKDFVASTDESKPHALILLDEENSMHLPRLLDFFKKHNQLKYIHPDLLAVMKRVKLQREEVRIFKDTALCPYVLEYGDCDDPHCYYRHNLTQFDAITKSDDIPTSGDIRIHILEVFSPTHYTARLLQHKEPHSTQWTEVRRSNKAALFAMQLDLHYRQVNQLTQHWPLQLNDLCVCKVQDIFQRVRIIDLPTIKYTDIVQKVKLTVKLIDLGGTKPIASDELFILDAKFKDFPQQALNIRLLGVVPFDNERNWDSKSTKSVQTWITGNIGKHDCVHASISFALAGTIWVKNVIVMEQLPTVGQYVYRINLKRTLLEKNFALISNKRGHQLQQLAEEIGILKDETVDADVEDTNTELEYESCNTDSSNLIKFSCNGDDTFDSAVVKADSLQTDEENVNDNNNSTEAEQLLQTTSTEEEEEKQRLDEEGKEEENWDDLNEEIRGNEVYLPLSASKYANDKPNAAAHPLQHNDSLISTPESERWCQLPLHRMVKVEIGDENENGNWTDIYMQLTDEVHLKDCEALLKIINQHIVQLKKLPAQSLQEEIRLAPAQNCIIKYDGLYLRAKLVGIYGEVTATRIYRFFLCDYACFVTVNEVDLYADFLYETTQQIVEFMPYQAVHCTLASVKLDRFAKRFAVTKDYLFAYAVKERASVSTTARGLDIKSYDILLYECDVENDFKKCVMFNKTLVEQSVAALDEETKHYLEFDAGIDLTGFDISEAEQLLQQPMTSDDGNSTQSNGVANFQELLQCIQRSFELDVAEMNSDEGCDEYKTRKTLRETKSICAAALEKQNEHEQMKQENLAKAISVAKQTAFAGGGPTVADKLPDVKEQPKVAKQLQAKTKPKTKRKYTISAEESDDCYAKGKPRSERSNSTASLASNASSLPPPPPLTPLHKRPQTTWYETECLIFLSIHAPDIDNYYLKVTHDTLIFAACIHGEEQVLLLNFLGTVQPDRVSHEVRGLNVVVRLVKSIYMKWPRLLQQTHKLPWLTYNLNVINRKEIEGLLPQQRLLMAMESAATARECRQRFGSDDSADDSDENNLFQNYTPIVNSEDTHDPTTELL